MKRTSVWLTAALTVCVLLAADSAQQKRDADETVLGAALHQEEVEGNLEKAIAAYKDFLARNPSDRALAATAQFHIGLCYEKLGKGEAQKAYQQVLSTYADQTEIASEARTRLTALLKSMAEDAKEQASRPVFRKITIPGKIDHDSRLSSDGSRLAFVSDGDLWVVNLRGQAAPDIAGEPVRLTQGANLGSFGMTWSGNQQWFGFNETEAPSRNIYVVSASGGAVRTLTRAVPVGGNDPLGLGLSQDGSRLAYSTGGNDGDVLRIVSVKTGETVMRLGHSEARSPVFSPDGRRVAYIRGGVQLGENIPPRSEVRVVRLADGSDIRLAEVPGRFLRSPAWSPDGSLLAFLGDSRELWIAPLLETGAAAGVPTKLSLPLDAYRIAGWSADSKIGLVCLTPFHSPIYTVPLSGGRATQVTADPEEEGLGFFSPQWSPDGKTIFFRYGKGETASVPAAGGPVRAITRRGPKIIETLPGGGNHISPDGKRIVFSAYQEGDMRVRLWIMPVSGGEPVRLPMKLELNAWQPRWSPDGKWIAFEAERGLSDDKLDENIYVVSSQGGEPRQLTKHTSYCELAAWSPAGDEIAYACNDNTIRIVRFEGGEPRVVVKAEGLNTRGGSLAWTPDGTKLLYTATGRIWSVPVSGGQLEEIRTGIESNHWQFSLSPDGRRIAFNAPSGLEPELWLMEDFLSLVKSATR